MTTTRQEFSAEDAAPVVLYVKADADSKFAFPMLLGDFNPGMAIPKHDKVELSYTSGDLTGVVYSLTGSTVFTLGLTYSSGNLSTVVKV